MFKFAIHFSCALALIVGTRALIAAPLGGNSPDVAVANKTASSNSNRMTARRTDASNVDEASPPGTDESGPSGANEARVLSADEAAPLSANEAAQLAITGQPMVAGQQAAVAAAEQSATAAAQLPDPKLRAGLKDYPITGSESFSFTRDNFTMLTIGVGQEFPREEKRRLRGVRGQLDAEQKKIELDVMLRQIRRDAALAWLDAYYPQQAAKLVEAQQRESQLQIERLGIGYRAGKNSQADVLAERVGFDLLRERQAEFDKRVEQARAGLARWIGDDALRPLADKLARDQPADLSTLLRLAESHPHLNTLTKQIEQAETEIALAKQAYKPDWSLDVYYGARPAFADFVGVQVGVDLPLFTKNRQDRVLSSKLALAEQARSLREDALRVIRADIKRYHAEWQSAENRLSRLFDQNILPQARQRIDAALAAYRSGRGDLLSVLDARRAELDLMLQRLALQVEQARAYEQLRYFSELEPQS